MSPNEAQLRAALQEGEGDRNALDATALISHAVRVRRDRNRRITSIAGGVAVVAVVGVGLTALVTSGQGSESAGSSSGGGAALNGGLQALSPQASSAAAGGAVAGPASAPHESIRSAASSSLPYALSANRAAAKASTLKCPATADRYMLPGGGGSGQFGSSDPLFAGQVAAMRICAYPQRVGAHVQTSVYGAAAADQVASQLDAAPSARASKACPANTDFAGGEIEFLAVNAKGQALKPVVLTLECVSSQATNGTAVRYVLTVPTPALKLLSANGPPRPGRTMVGSPLH